MARPKKESRADNGKLIQKTHKYLAEPTELQEYRMENCLGSLCRLGNESIAERKDSYRNIGKGLTYTEQQNALPGKKDPALCRVHSQVARTACDEWTRRLRSSLTM